MPSEALAKDGSARTRVASDGYAFSQFLTAFAALSCLRGRLGVFYVYMLKSESSEDQRYTGFTTDLQQRFKKHNEGASSHTAKYRPWRLVAYFAFEDERRAREFEFYLKTGSGKAFANKRLW